MERTVAPPPVAAPAAVPHYAPPPPVMAPPVMAPRPAGFFGNHPFLAGMMGGVVGAGLGSMLFGHEAMAAGEGAGGAGMLGTLLQLALLGGLIWWVLRLFRGSPAVSSEPVMMPQGMVSPRPVAKLAKEFEPADADKQVFGQILLEIQRAWSNGDIAAIKQLATPEMVSYLADDLAADSNRGVRNVVDNVQLVKGEVTEAWVEADRQYVTAVMTFASHDYTVRMDNGTVVEGNPQQATENVEAWTFVRFSNGRWLLSAVERE